MRNKNNDFYLQDAPEISTFVLQLQPKALVLPETVAKVR
jgi:hypothetical protein